MGGNVRINSPEDESNFSPSLFGLCNHCDQIKRKKSYFFAQSLVLARAIARDIHIQRWETTKGFTVFGLAAVIAVNLHACWAVDFGD